MASNVFHPEILVNLIIIGPPGTGKKSFIRAVTNFQLVIPESPEAISSVYESSYKMYDKRLLVTIWYVRNLENSVEQIKEICLRSTSSSVVLFWYAIDIPSSLTSLSRDYITLLRDRGRFHFMSLLVGSKVDIRMEGTRPCLQFLQGENIKTSFHLGDFVECSTKIEQSVRDVFLKAAFIALGLEHD